MSLFNSPFAIASAIDCYAGLMPEQQINYYDLGTAQNARSPGEQQKRMFAVAKYLNLWNRRPTDDLTPNYYAELHDYLNWGVSPPKLSPGYLRVMIDIEMGIWQP